ncbi:MAG TPA: transglutaminase domain-containing protein, partial [Polyangiaceae bacterium]|nr:transglutaminase domain-containing protein [Polyangiaceae bacterium]
TLYVRDPQLRRIGVGGAARDDDDRFFGDMVVQLRAGEHVRIPTVGPDARVLELMTSPKTDVSLWRDGAGNWFALADSSERVRVVTELVIERDTFAGEFDDVSWTSLTVPAQPAAHHAAFQQVAQAIGISRNMTPRQVVTTMVTYFRSFAPSNEPPNDQEDIYLALALSKKGVCRHRAFAFLVTALNIGIPARLIHNEAHAWVEVHDGRLWRRIDLGGAALDLADDPELDRPPHMPPPDEFPWPTGRDSGSELARRDRADAMRERNEQQSNDATDPSAPPSSSGEPTQDPSAPPNPNARDLPETTLSVDTIDADIFRGLPVRIKGTARAEGRPCAHVRVDVLLRVRGETNERRLGSLSTDERGVYDGAVVVPRDVPIGDHELSVATHGSTRCGTGRAW